MSDSAEKSAEKPVEKASPKASAENAEKPVECGKKHGELHKITSDGDCFFNSILYSMVHHPCGNILEKSELPNTIQGLRHLLSESGLNLQCYTEIFEKLKSLTKGQLEEEYGEEEIYEENSKGKLKAIRRIKVPYPWIIEFLKLKHKKGSKEAFTIEKFIEYANHQMTTTNEFASICEVDAMTKLLNSRNIELDIKWGIPTAVMDFGTEERPIINIKYNGLDHYDAIVPKTENSEGGKRKTRKMKKNKRKTRHRY
jgi:hypothetical protein